MQLYSAEHNFYLKERREKKLVLALRAKNKCGKHELNAVRLAADSSCFCYTLGCKGKRKGFAPA